MIDLFSEDVRLPRDAKFPRRRESIHDIYYDYPDFRLLKNGVRLRRGTALGSAR